MATIASILEAKRAFLRIRSVLVLSSIQGFEMARRCLVRALVYHLG